MWHTESFISVFQMFLEPLLFQEHLFGGKALSGARGGGIYFTGAVEPVELWGQDGRVAARCGVAWRGAV